MTTKSQKYKIDESILINDEVTVEQHLLEAILMGETRESALIKAEKIIKCIIESENLNDLFDKFNDVIKANPIGPMTLYAILVKQEKLEASHRAKLMVGLRLENDPKQMALKEIRNIYETQKTQFKRRGYSSQFIREMHDKFPIIESRKTIENLVTRLNKENQHIPR